MINVCPVCSAQLESGAVFCPCCMTQLYSKKQIPKPKRKITNRKKAIVICVTTLLVISIIAGGVFGVLYHKKHSPICTIEQFKEAAPIVSEKMEIDDLWDTEGFIDAHTFVNDNVIQYTTTLNMDDEILSLFFYNEGEEVYAYITDVDDRDFDNAQNILKCVTQSVSNYYFTDIDNVFNNERLYPKSTLDRPFDTQYTDWLMRTEKYNDDIESGGVITTRYIPMKSDDITVIYAVVERKYNDKILYDMLVEIERQ